MAKIIAWTPRPAGPTARIHEGEADILFFTGVRYSRAEDEPPARARRKPSDKPSPGEKKQACRRSAAPRRPRRHAG